jgi:hypothetical protein
MVNRGKQIKTKILELLFNHLYTFYYATVHLQDQNGLHRSQIEVPEAILGHLWPQKLTNCVAELVARYNNLEDRRQDNGGRGL